MDFKSGDKVLLRGPSRMRMTVKSVSAAGVLCEWSDAILRGELTVSPASLEQLIAYERAPPVRQELAAHSGKGE
jgi:uncharacterized protein YodC (DUF2158 family)